MKKLLAIFCVAIFTVGSAKAQIKLEDIPFDLDAILGKVKLLTVKKKFNPVFSLGNYQINKVGILGEKLKGVKILGDIFQTKRIDQIMGMYKTYKTGLVVFKVLAGAGTVISTYSAVRGMTVDGKFSEKTVKQLLYPALASVATGVITKVLTKAAAYKAVDVFNGVVKEKIKDIFSIQPASQNLGIGVYVKL